MKTGGAQCRFSPTCASTYGATIRDRGAGTRRYGQADLEHEPRARVVSWSPLGLDVHRDFAEVAEAVPGGGVRRIGRVRTTPAALRAFAERIKASPAGFWVQPGREA